MINSSGTWKITKLLPVAIFEQINLQEKFEGQIPSRSRDNFLAHVISMSSLLFLHWSLYCMFVDESCTESYPSCVDAPKKVQGLLLNRILVEWTA